ncbi:MAG: LysM peptidoglycan-binding domain-containing protein [Phycisphaerales bacterium JB052]
MAPPGKEAAVTKESKLALIIGFVLVLVVGVLVSDHFSQASNMTLDTMRADQNRDEPIIAHLGTREQAAIDQAIDRGGRQPSQASPGEESQPVIISSVPRDRSLIEQAFHEARSVVQNTDLPPAVEPTKVQEPTQHSRTNIRPLPTKTYQSYTVVQGDSLIGIARRLLGDGDRYVEIENLNADKLGPDSILQIGMQLKLPGDARILTSGSRQTRTSGNASGNTRNYTVAPGDTLGEISINLLGTSKRMNEIVELNGLSSPDQIFVGMTLKIPSK